MQEMLEVIYEEVVCHTKAIKNVEKEVEKEIEELLKPYQEEKTWDMEMVRDLMYATQNIALKKGFKQGVRTSAFLLKEILKES